MNREMRLKKMVAFYMEKKGLPEDKAKARAEATLLDLEGRELYAENRDEIRKVIAEQMSKGVVGKELQKFPGGFEGCVRHFADDPDWHPKGGGDRTEAARKLCAYMAV